MDIKKNRVLKTRKTRKTRKAQKARKTRKTRKERKAVSRRNRRTQRGGLIEQYEGVFNSLDDQWVLTGSEAVRLLTLHCGIADKYPIKPNDLDILYVGNEDDLGRYIGGFMRKGPKGRSMTYENDSGRSFDINVESAVSYYVVNGVRIFSPMSMLDTYEEDSFIRGAKDDIKIAALREIVPKMAALERKTMRVPRASRFITEDSITARSLF